MSQRRKYNGGDERLLCADIDVVIAHVHFFVHVHAPVFLSPRLPPPPPLHPLLRCPCPTARSPRSPSSTASKRTHANRVKLSSVFRLLFTRPPKKNKKKKNKKKGVDKKKEGSQTNNVGYMAANNFQPVRKDTRRPGQDTQRLAPHICN